MKNHGSYGIYIRTSEKLIDTPKVILESDGRTECKQKQIDCSAGLHANLMLQSKDEEFLFVWTINRSAKELIKLSLHVLEKILMWVFLGLIMSQKTPYTIILL